MTTFNTGNPVGSVDPRDLYDNAENLDNLVNHPTKTELQDRLGVPRKTWHGMEQDFQQFLVNSGYTGTGAGGAYEDYDADGPLTITALNQIFTKDGEFYRLKPDQAMPYTTTTWATDEVNMVAMGDAALRQELAVGTAEVSSSTGVQEIADALNDRLVVGSAVLNVNSIASLLALDVAQVQDGQQISVLSYHAPIFPSVNFKGGGHFFWDSSSQEDDNGITVIKIPGVSAGRFIRKEVEFINPFWAGAKGDGVADDFSAINDALALAITLKVPLKLGPGKYLVNGTFDFDALPSGGASIIGPEIRLDRDTYAAELVGDSGLAIMFKQSFSSEQRSLKFKNLSFKSKEPWDDLVQRADLRALDLHRCPWSEFENLAFFGLSSGIHARSCYFSKFSKITVNRCKQGIFVDGDDGSGGYGFADHCELNGIEVGGFVNDFGLRLRGSKASVINGFDAEAGYTGFGLRLEAVKSTKITGLYIESFTNSAPVKIGPIEGSPLDNLDDFSQEVVIDGVHGLANTAGLVVLERGSFNITLKNIREFRYDAAGRESQTSDWLVTTGVPISRDVFHYLYNIRIEDSSGSDRVPAVLTNNPRCQSFMANGTVVERAGTRGYYGLTLDVGTSYVNVPLSTSSYVVEQGTYGQDLSITASTTANSRKIIVDNTSQLNVGTWIDVGNESKFKITSIDRGSKEVWLGRVCATTQSGAVVQYSPPTLI